MFTPQNFKNENIAEVKDFIKHNGFGILITKTSGKILATHIPLELNINEEGKDVLYGHIAKMNPQGMDFVDDEEILVIFNGPHSYVSSSWYGHENVPTWNYIAVHVYGTLKKITGDALYQSLKRLVDKYETNMESPVSVDRMSEKTLLQMKGIIGFELEITNIQASYKLSQNRNEIDHANIIKQLERAVDPQSVEIAKQMRKCPIKSM